MDSFFQICGKLKSEDFPSTFGKIEVFVFQMYENLNNNLQDDEKNANYIYFVLIAFACSSFSSEYGKK
jgi:hypothetical protein